ncbi:MAG: 50S ribosomal protein L24 [Deltaproteobacteria bacterium]|nr:50S ribosomal protein L24 [Deltaproteobacteria bacterium]
MKIRKNDTVKVLSGQHKGKTAKVLEVLPDEGYVRLEAVGTVKKHLKPNRSNKNPQGGIVEMQALIHISKVALVTPKSATPVRVGYRLTDDGKKLRVARGKKTKLEAID